MASQAKSIYRYIYIRLLSDCSGTRYPADLSTCGATAGTGTKRNLTNYWMIPVFTKSIIRPWVLPTTQLDKSIIFFGNYDHHPVGPNNYRLAKGQFINIWLFQLIYYWNKAIRFWTANCKKCITYYIDKTGYPSGFSQKNSGLRRIVFDKSCLRSIILHQKNLACGAFWFTKTRPW